MENVRETIFTATPTLSALLSKHSHREIVSMARILHGRHFCMKMRIIWNRRSLISWLFLANLFLQSKFNLLLLTLAFRRIAKLY